MARSVPLPALLACLRGSPPAGIDWERAILAANRTLTTGTMAERLLSSAVELPEDVRSFLRIIQDRTIERNRRLAGQAAEAASCLNRAGITPILMKGIAIRQTMGEGRYIGRILSDIDFMIPAAALDEAFACLREIGYRPYCDADGPMSALFRPDDVGMIDLHCRLKTQVPLFDHDSIARECTLIAMGGAEALLPAPTVQVLILILHDQLQDRDYWRGLVDLRHLLDIEALSGSPEGVDWGLLSSFFPAGYPRSALRTQLRTIVNLLDVSMPGRHYRGWWPHLQYRRRIVQARWPLMMRLLTFLTLIFDPPLMRDRASKPAMAVGRKGPPAKMLRRFHRYGRERAAGKI